MDTESVNKKRPESAEQAGALTNVEYWNKQQSAAASGQRNCRKPKWYHPLSRFLPKSPDITLLEVGAVPGDILLFFAQTLHYRCTGVDFSPQIRHLQDRFNKLGVEAKFIETDFFSWANDELFDIVYSNGFIEHFTDYEMVINKHWEKVVPSGLMILRIPTFKTPLQWWIRQTFYEPWFLQEVLASHNLDIMTLNALKRCVMRVCPDGKLLEAIQEPGIPLWFSMNMKGIRKHFGRQLLWFVLKAFDRVLCTFRISCKWCAGVALVVVRKPAAI